jgi:hypothetical protein
MNHGKRTRQIAERLEERLRADPVRYSGVQIFYDHGDSSKTEVCQPTSYIGRKYGADATLSGLDIVLVCKGKVFLLVEVEESQVRPKTILGDIFSVVLSERVRIKAKSYPIEDATMIVAMIVNSKGQQAKKYIRLERRLHKFLNALRSIKQKTRLDKFRIVTSHPDDIVRRIERLVRLEIGKGVAVR